ncbi:hypothetical protein JKG68_09555 [Microvirga aerilata]|jgi:hypothetical protein|uniref:Uncharacterized protein n=1 Tax=Microvirga aerilata TaxID=670292 RepID=A0A936Z6Z2_9HYPH|nr:hypothetical protein [Microvirga aerilata]MBL0404211.1 hypothetical protein [Microvirga aerilata]
MGNAGYGNHTEDTKNYVDIKRSDPQTGGQETGGQETGGQASPEPQTGAKQPAAGPHSKPSLTNPDSTPGTGALPDPGDRDATDTTSS